MVNARIPASTSQSHPAPRGLAWLVVALALVLTVLVSVSGCRETPIDGSSADTTLRVPPKQDDDTTVVSERRANPDTVIESDHFIVIDTLIREIVVRDTVRVYDTVVVHNRHTRAQVREAQIYCFVPKGDSLGIDSAEFTVQPTQFIVTKASPEWRVKFEATFQLARLLPEEKFGKHEMTTLYVHVPDAPLRHGALQLKDNPDFGMGASLIWSGRFFRTGTEPPYRFNSAQFVVSKIDYDQRLLYVDLMCSFAVGWQNYRGARIVMRLSY